jgi:diadenosine tetraphosphate (Ap4A) HIT family hydrolase
MKDLPKPPPKAIFYQDDKLYACLASQPLTRGHSIVAWKEKIEDLNKLERADYEHLMAVVEKARQALMETLALEKVYLLYMDETKHVHWHLIPRYKEQGLTVLNHQAEKLENFYLTAKIKANWQ